MVAFRPSVCLVLVVLIACDARQPDAEPAEPLSSLERRVQEGAVEYADINHLWHIARGDGPDARRAAALLPAVHVWRGDFERAARALGVYAELPGDARDGRGALEALARALRARLSWCSSTRELETLLELSDGLARLDPVFEEERRHIASQAQVMRASWDDLQRRIDEICTHGAD